MKAAKFFSICEIVCFVGLALSYAGEFLCAFVVQGTDKDIFQMGLFLFWLLIGAVGNLQSDLRCCDVQAAVRPGGAADAVALHHCNEVHRDSNVPAEFLFRHDLRHVYADFPDDAAGRALTNAGCLVCHDGLVRLLHCAHPARVQAGQNQHRTAVLQVISQFIYVVDVISLFFIRKTVKECETTQ